MDPNTVDWSRVCGVQEGSSRGWIKICVLPQGHHRNHPVKHQFEWIKGHPDADPNGPGVSAEPAAEPLPRREPGAELPKVPLNPLNEPNVTRFPRRGRRAEKPEGPVSQPLGDPDRHRRLLKGGGDWKPERPADREPEPEGGPIPPGVEGQSLGTRNKPAPSDAATTSGEGSGMASVEELRAAASTVLGKTDEAMGAAHAALVQVEEAGDALSNAIQAMVKARAACVAAREQAEEARLFAGSVFVSAEHEAALSGMGHLTAMEDRIDVAIRNLLLADGKTGEAKPPLSVAKLALDPEGEESAIGAALAAKGMFQAYVGGL